MSKKEELIKAIRQAYAKVAQIDEDSGKIYSDAKEQLRLHSVDPIAYSPTAEDAQRARALARRYAESYEAIAVLFDQLDVEQQRAHSEWKGNR